MKPNLLEKLGSTSELEIFEMLHHGGDASAFDFVERVKIWRLPGGDTKKIKIENNIETPDCRILFCAKKFSQL